jgi:hypothetical protein
MDKFIRWYHFYFKEILWFTIGWLSLSGLTDLAHGDISSAMLNLFLIVVNWYLYKTR